MGKTILQCGVNILESIPGVGSWKTQDKRFESTGKQTDDSSKCVAYATAGDCRFYECFHKKFPCDVFSMSHMNVVELPLCRDMDCFGDFFDSKGNEWPRKNKLCLMRKLLPVFNDISVNCADLPLLIFKNRKDCLHETQFCSILGVRKNRFAVDRITSLKSYPAVLPRKAGMTTTERDYVYSELSDVRHLMGDKDVCQTK
ncbi:hypothetical protein NP493_860g02131 [Ridgeia piscesae]|uniref:Uncharacterized protein n=1 Tax=Ridgeia piscesae TaxID=27915 RepID=A0AAD9KLT1_RIDPI|nr:hypothetical protein NP493_860g02131 [Ridgeia piscesae]